MLRQVAAEAPQAPHDTPHDTPHDMRQEAGAGLVTAAELAQMKGDAALAAIRQAMGTLLRQVLRSPDSGLPGPDAGDIGLSAFGVDSLMAMELRSRIRAWVNVELPTHMLVGDATLAQVAGLIHEKVLLGLLVNGAGTAGGGTAPEQATDDVFVL
jgi:hypothetical protein